VFHLWLFAANARKRRIIIPVAEDLFRVVFDVF